MDDTTLNQQNYQHIKAKLRDDLQRELKSKAGLENLLQAGKEGKAKLPTEKLQPIRCRIRHQRRILQDELKHYQ